MLVNVYGTTATSSSANTTSLGFARLMLKLSSSYATNFAMISIPEIVFTVTVLGL